MDQGAATWILRVHYCRSSTRVPKCSLLCWSGLHQAREPLESQAFIALPRSKLAEQTTPAFVSIEERPHGTSPCRVFCVTARAQMILYPTACSALALLMGSDERFRRVVTVHACGALYYIFSLYRQTNPEENLPFKVHLKRVCVLDKSLVVHSRDCLLAGCLSLLLQFDVQRSGLGPVAGGRQYLLATGGHLCATEQSWQRPASLS